MTDIKRKRMGRESFRFSEAHRDALATLAGGQSKGALIRQWIDQAIAGLGLTPLPKSKKKQRRKPVAGEDFRLPPDPELVQQLVMLGNMHANIAQQLLSCRLQSQVVDVEKVLFVVTLINGHLEYLVENYTVAKTGQGDATSGEASP